MEYTTLSSGVKMPMLGYGVFQIDDATTERCVADAIAAVTGSSTRRRPTATSTALVRACVRAAWTATTSSW